MGVSVSAVYTFDFTNLVSLPLRTPLNPHLKLLSERYSSLYGKHFSIFSIVRRELFLFIVFEPIPDSFGASLLFCAQTLTMSMASLYRRSLTSPPAIDFASVEGKVRILNFFRSMDLKIRVLGFNYSFASG